VDVLEAQLHRKIAQSQQANRYRTLEPIDSSQGRCVIIDDETLINFSSNDYLGLANHASLRSHARDALERFGVGSGASALLSGRSVVHDELERRLATFMHAEAALLYSSGYLANVGTIGALIGRHDNAFQDRLNHASLIDAVTLSRSHSHRYQHADPTDLRQQLSNADGRRNWIITDTVFSMDGDVAPLTDLAQLAREFGATLIGDDAHGIGVLGDGRGAAVEFGLSPRDMPVHVVTFGKALGTAGAAVVGSAALIDTLIQSSRTFIYDTAPPPAIAAATVAALELISGDPSIVARLKSNIETFRALTTDLPLLPSSTPIQAFMVGEETDALNLARNLRNNGFYVRAIRPPTVPVGTARLRLCLSAAHTHDDIDRLVATLRAARPIVTP
jgi:8-amino-7-oxononanoate synthase